MTVPTTTAGKSAADPRPAPRRVAVLVFNAFTNDSRVLNVAQSLAGWGDGVDVVAVEVGVEEPAGAPGVRVVRLPFDPLYRRLWDDRASFLRPWRHGRDIGTTLRARLRGAGPGRAAVTLVAVLVLGIPWVLISGAYYALARLASVARRAAGRPDTRRRGAWLEERYKRFLFLAPHAVRVVTWSREVLTAYGDGRLEPAAVWHANDLETLPVALVLRRRYGGRVVYDSHEIWMEMPGPSRMGRQRRWLLAAAERWMAHRADARVTINAELAHELQRRWSTARPVVIRSLPPLWSPPPGFESPLRAALDQLGIARSRRLILSHGNFQAGRGIEPLLAAAEGIDAVALAFLGDGPLAGRIREAAARPVWHGRLAVLPMVPPEDVLAWVAGTDFSACLIEPINTNYRLSSPNKLFQAIAAGVPVIASDGGPIREVVERYDIGVTCDPTDPHDIARALGHLLDLSPADHDALRSNARRAHLEELNWEREAGRLREVYASLATDGGTAGGGSDPRP